MFVYNKKGLVSKTVDVRNSQTTYYYYDFNGSVTGEYRQSKSGALSYFKSYDNDGNRVEKTSINGQVKTITTGTDSDGNAFVSNDGMTMTWKNGRQLATLQTDENSISYNYDSNSVRISKTVNGVKYTYAYLNGMLLYETRGDAKFWYSYDANGTLYNVKYTLADNGTVYSYYYTHNSGGYIVGIYSGSGVLTAQYEYDAWGNVLSITDRNGNAITSATNIGNLNPFRYRGYYLDTETGLHFRRLK